MTRIIFASVCLFAFVSSINAAEPTLADGTTSVLKTTEAKVAEPAPAAVACADALREVNLLPIQARRLARQADRQEARATRNCCKCNCDNNCNKKRTALIADRNRCKCGCN